MSGRQFTFPPKIGGGNVVMRQMLVGELDDILEAEMARVGASGGLGFARAQSACIQACIVSFRGEPWPRGTDGEKKWRSLTPQVKTCLSMAYNEMHTLNEADGADFLKTAGDPG